MAKSRDRPPSRPRTPVLPDRPPSPARKPPPSAISGPAPDAPSPLLPPPSRPTRQRQRPPGQPAPPRPAGRFLRLPAPPGAPSAVPPAGARAFPTAFSVAPRSLAARAPSPAGARMSASPVLNAPAGGVIVLRVAAWPAGSLAARTAPERWVLRQRLLSWAAAPGRRVPRPPLRSGARCRGLPRLPPRSTFAGPSAKLRYDQSRPLARQPTAGRAPRPRLPACSLRSPPSGGGPCS